MIHSTKGANFEDIVNINRSLAVQFLQRNGVCTRAQLSKELCLTQASISKIIGELMCSGIVEETGFLSGEKGRRSIGIRLTANDKRVIGARLSRRSVAAGVFTLSGERKESFLQPLPDGISAHDALNGLKALIKKCLAVCPDAASIGVAVPGPYHSKSGTILLMTEMEGMERIPLKEELCKAFDQPLILCHDANSGAWASWWLEPSARSGDLVYFLVGEGVGAGVIQNGTLLLGEHGCAGEVGHISVDVNGERCKCGNRGCLELYCSSLSFVRRARQALPRHPESSLFKLSALSPKEIFQAAERGDAFARELVCEAAYWIGCGVVTLIHAYDPTAVVIGNEMAGGGTLLLQEVQRVVHERMIAPLADPVQISLSAYPGDSILYGAAAAAIDYCLKTPHTLA